MRLTKRCPVCNKICEVIDESLISATNSIITKYQCGHIRIHRQLVAKDFDLTSEDGKKPFQYQLDGAAWAIRNNVRVLLADEQGVGKTLQAFLVAKSDPSEFSPILIVCKASLKTQMSQEGYRWCEFATQEISSNDDMIVPGLDGYIIGYDSLVHSEFKNKRGKQIERGIKDLDAILDKMKPRLLILDECQKVKNKEAKVTKRVQELARKVPYIMALSGTPIENNGREYFPVLNMVVPEKVSNENNFVSRWFDTYWSGYQQKVGGIRDIKAWKDFTQNFILRRTRKEVLPDLPPVDRRFMFEELGEKVEEAYKATFKEFQDFYYYGGGDKFQRDGNILAYLSKMRHITGIAKIPGTVDLVQDFLDNTDRKIVVFTHHIDVAQELVSRITQFHPQLVYVPSPIDPSKLDKFRSDPNARVLVGNTLSLGTGHNLQVASECILMEREWNPSKEEQAEGRLPRPGQTADKITATYMTAVGTVDEYFATIVEKKRGIMSSTLDGADYKWDESSMIKELAEVLASKGGSKWGW